MRFIQKQSMPQALIDWKSHLWSNGVRATFPMLDKEENRELKRKLKRSLILEQGYICCYCGIRIGEGDSHIEHLKPQSTYKADQLNYQNLLASCLSTIKAADETRCGHEKGNWYEADRFVSPLDQDCEGFFRYIPGNGQILPVDTALGLPNEKARVTIQRLNLNAYALTQARAEAIYAILYEGIEDTPLNKQEIERLIEEYQVPDEDGKLHPFCSAILYSLKEELENLVAKLKICRQG